MNRYNHPHARTLSVRTACFEQRPGPLKSHFGTPCSVFDAGRRALQTLALLLALSATALIIEGLVFEQYAAANTVNLVTIDPANPPPNVLSHHEISRLQVLNATKSLGFLSRSSPDERTALGRVKGEESQIGFWDFSSGEFMPIEWPDGFTVVLTAWIEADQLRLIVEDSETGAYHLAQLDRREQRVWIRTQQLPITGDIKALSPDGRYLAVSAVIEPEVETHAGSLAARRSMSSTDASPRMRTVDKIELPTMFQAAGAFSASTLEVTAEPSQLLVFDLQTNSSRKLLDLPETALIYGIAFSPDGRRLAFVQNHFVNNGLPLDKNRDRPFESLMALITQDALGWLQPLDNPMHVNSRLLMFDLSGPETLMHALGSADLPVEFLQFANIAPVWSPSGERLLVTLNVPATLAGRVWPIYYKPQAAIHLVLDGALQILGHLDEAPLNFPAQPPLRFWLDENQLVFGIIEQADYAFYRYRLDTTHLTKIAHGGTLQDIVSLPTQNAVMLVRHSASEAAELWKLDLTSGEAWKMSALNAEPTAAADVVAHPVDFTLGNGETFTGYWFAPQTMSWPPRQEQVVFWQAGGPGVPMTNAWGTHVESPLTLLPSFGVNVLMVPLHKRPGASPATWTALADGENFGTIDIDAMAEIAQQLRERGWVSPRGLGISGCSYGGYLSSQSIVRHPDLWAAANPQCSLVDLISEFQIGYGAHIAYLMGATPWDAWPHYIDASPGYHGHRVQTHTLIFHGTQDFLSLGVMENFFYAIQAAGNADARMLRFLGEPHGLYESNSQSHAAQEQIRWFRTYLK